MCAGPLIAALKAREVKKVSQGCPFNWAAQYPVVKHPAVHILPVPQMKRKLFRVGQITQSPIPSTSQWTQPSFPQTSVVHTYIGGAEEGRTVKCHIFVTASVHLVFSSCILPNRTARGGD
jgi:hypothetical protein